MTFKSVRRLISVGLMLCVGLAFGVCILGGCVGSLEGGSLSAHENEQVAERVGGFGTLPPRPQDAADAPPDCNAGDNGAIELNAVTCGPPSLGAPCSVLCAEIGASCISQRIHPYLKESIAKGLLSGCCSCKGTGYCEYLFSNGDRCKRFSDRLPGFEWLCGIPGGK